ncbi:DUF6325 family protein [Cryobacterium arcticum]|uniref:DUF1269 domain-containing family protein n=1 Tax=Cryobacterium arcticum TaxID=670052 RepID=A0A317ZR03_9MICO|nr:DUF6325 family protein [Cryobacterium arcticum]PXA67175.1 DUF1269 domain-containing family protein [Cryobacterium arcticum]
MADDETEYAAPVDFVIIEFPAGEQNFSGEVIEQLVALVDSGTIRLIDGMVLVKDADGDVEASELSDLDELGPLARIAADLADFLAADDVAHLAAAMDPGSVAGVLVYENVWAAPFSAAARRAGGRLIADGRIHSQDIADALEADAALQEQGA